MRKVEESIIRLRFISQQSVLNKENINKKIDNLFDNKLSSEFTHRDLTLGLYGIIDDIDCNTRMKYSKEISNIINNILN